LVLLLKTELFKGSLFMPLTIHFLSKERTCAKKGNEKGDEENERNLC
jgi:hypothetical protein